ncbi:MAG TPA: efflux RND transporter permease subunit [Terriglobales bacterium]|nr:efflux RND transporter permease subunit [Terriglobales bacterium]
MRLEPLLERLRTTGATAERYWFTRFAKPLIFLTIVLALAGIYLAFTIPISVFPTTDFPRVVIGVDNGVMPIDQMTVTITRPIEESVNSVPGLISVRSITSRGAAEVDLFFDWHVDMVLTLQQVDAALARVRSELPATVVISTHRLTFASFPIIGYSLTSDSVPQTQLWEMAVYDLKPRLNRLNGVAAVVVQGGEQPEFHITPSPAKLLASGVTVTDILDSVRRTNLIDSPGLLDQNHQVYLTLVSGQVTSPEQLGQVVVKTTPAGVPVKIGDVALVERSVKPLHTAVTANGKPAVLLNITRQPDSNTVDVANLVHDEVASLQRSLPPGVHLQPFYDQSEIVTESIKSVRDAILIGLVLASLIMVLFLRDWGASIVAALVIPATVLITFIVLKLLGQSFNLMTLGGLAAAVGLVIDDAIVVVENVALHRNAGQGRLEAIRSALSEISVPLVGSTITPIVVFLPLIAITGVTGIFFRALAITVSVSLLTSLVLALSWTPTLSQYFIGLNQTGEPSEHPATKERMFAAEEATLSGPFLRIVEFYEKCLRFALERPRWIAIFSVVLIVTSVVCYGVMGNDLLPEMDEGGFILDYLTPAGTSLAETQRVVGHIEKMILEVPEVQGESRRTGLELGLATVTEVNRGDIAVKLKRERSRGTDEVIAELRSRIAREEPGIDVEFVQVLQDMIGDLSNEPEDVFIKLYSNDGALLRTWAPQIADAISKVDGVVDLRNGIDNTISGPATLFTVDPTLTARAGFTPEEVSTDAQALLEGMPAENPVVANDRTYVVRVRFPDPNRSSLDAMKNTLIVSGSGRTATLGSLAAVTELPGQTEVRRENLQRVVSVTARLEGRDLGSAMTAVRKAVSALKIPSSIRLQYGGKYEEQQKAFHDLMLVLVLAIVLVFIVLLFEFRTIAAPLAILASAVLSTSGVLLALLVTRTTFNIASFMGLIMVIGIVAKNGILLLDAEQKFRADGMSPRDAMIQAGRRRLRPIMMTALAAAAGMLPLALAIGAGSQMLQPLAIAVIGGITISIVLSLVITPTVHYYLSHAESPPDS